MRVEIPGKMIRWAIERSQKDEAELVRRYPKLPDWERGATHPTLKQLEDFAKATNTPFGFLLLPEPPEEKTPIPDFRTHRGRHIPQISPNLRDTIYACQLRQDWYREFVEKNGLERPRFVGSLTVNDSIETSAGKIQEVLGFDVDMRRKLPTWEDALRIFAEKIEEVGVLVMKNGVVGNNTSRKLDPLEFRGFALVDDVAPLIFVNGADTKAAQIFTLAHEFAHVWLGESAISDSGVQWDPDREVERWCNAAAAELLVPIQRFSEELRPHAGLTEELNRIARVFKVSTLVALRRMKDTGSLTKDEYVRAFEGELERIRQFDDTKGSEGGNPYLTIPVRNSKRFTKALITDTLEGNTLYREASKMLGISKESTFRELSSRIGYGAT